jgi:hypothetical protein
MQGKLQNEKLPFRMSLSSNLKHKVGLNLSSAEKQFVFIFVVIYKIHFSDAANCGI